MTNRDPYDGGPAGEGWSTGAIAAVIIAAVVILGAIGYGMSHKSQTASNPPPPAASSPPTTTGQGGTPARPGGNP